jgi:hypothetical protein
MYYIVNEKYLSVASFSFDEPFFVKFNKALFDFHGKYRLLLTNMDEIKFTRQRLV